MDPEGNLIKGLGGALLRERIVAAASRRFLVIVDEGKLVERLGTRAPVPVESLPFGWTATRDALRLLGCEPRLRESGGTPVRTDQGNLLLDCRFPPIEDPGGLARRIEAVPGALGHGLFLGMAHEVIVGAPEGARILSFAR